MGRCVNSFPCFSRALRALPGSGAPGSIPTSRSSFPRGRHLGKYAEGNLGPRSFFFRGAAGAMNLRAQNLAVFCELASGVDDDTWLYHLRRGDYSARLARTIKDADLAREVASVEQAAQLTPADSRRAIREAIDARYMLPG